MNAVNLIIAQMELECIGLNSDGLLCRIPGKNPDAIHRLFVVKHDMGYSAFIREDVSPAVIEKLRMMDPSDLFHDTRLVSGMLYGTRTGSSWAGSAYRFTDPYPDNGIDMVQYTGSKFVIKINGQDESWAWSSRSNSRCAELATETAESHRRNGFATMVSAAWANHQLKKGRIPFYSHKVENLPSRNLAACLGVTHFMDCVSYE